MRGTAGPLVPRKRAHGRCAGGGCPCYCRSFGLSATASDGGGTIDRRQPEPATPITPQGRIHSTEVAHEQPRRDNSSNATS